MAIKPLELNNSNQSKEGPVECLGKTFANDEERRRYYLDILAEKLKDPEFRKIEGFPIGEDEDILKLSDPPYYTACPNPWVADFIAEWEAQKPEKDADYHYHREPFAADVSEGKNNPIYNAHSYHTKVPHKAIMRYILHYTEQGDIVFDGFSGTGMTGVAAQLCGDRREVESLGYKVLDEDCILDENIDDAAGKTVWKEFSKLGARKVILNDLSPAATFISSVYSFPFDGVAFLKSANEILDQVDKDIGWMYETKHIDGCLGTINYTLFSDVFLCPECANDIVFWDEAVDLGEGKVNEVFNCSSCNTSLSKRNLERAWRNTFDNVINKTTHRAKQVPVMINYSVGSKRYEKRPDNSDIECLKKIQELEIPDIITPFRIHKGDKTCEPLRVGINFTHQFYTDRNLRYIGKIRSAIQDKYDNDSKLLFWVNAATRNLSILSKLGTGNYFGGGGGAVNAGILGTLYVPSFSVESSVRKMLKERAPKLSRALSFNKTSESLVMTQSSSQTSLPDSSIDYIFVDPPFGANIMYSDLNILWESWLKVFTNNKKEAIESKSQNKAANEYRVLMQKCFSELYRVLKPGRWMTVEFSNTKSSVWSSIQTALNEAGFIVSNVSALDKKLGSFNAVTNTTSVKQDLVISAYKPNGGFEKRFLNNTNEESVWDFTRTHLGYLPVSKKQGNELVKIPERDPRILFDQVVAYFVRNLRDVPLSSKEFQDGLLERFAERDGMVFLPEQVAQYDKARITSSQLRQLDIFVDDEASSIEWLCQLLNDKPQTYQDIHPKFINELSGWKKAEVQLELSTLLEQNFIKFDGDGQVPPQIHSYLSTNFKDLRNLPKDDSTLLIKAINRWYVPNPEREEDLQKLRERDLLKQFDEYKNHTGKKLKLVRMEAVRCGFKKAWQDRDYATIINVAEKIPQNLLQEDQKLLMWYDQAITRTGG